MLRKLLYGVVPLGAVVAAAFSFSSTPAAVSLKQVKQVVASDRPIATPVTGAEEVLLAHAGHGGRGGHSYGPHRYGSSSHRGHYYRGHYYRGHFYRGHYFRSYSFRSYSFRSRWYRSHSYSWREFPERSRF